MTFRSTAGAVLVLGAVAAACLPASAQEKKPPAATLDSTIATAPGKGLAAETIKTSATIVSIDAATRTVGMKRQDGKVVTMELGPEVRNFEQLKVGDRVHAEYTQALALELKKGGGGKGEVAVGDSMKRSEAGQKPGGAAVRQVSVLADVIKVDAKHKVVTLKGPGGNIVELVVDDPEQLKHIKQGDQVAALYSESLAIKVEAAK